MAPENAQRAPKAPTSAKPLKRWQIDPKKHHAMKIAEADSPRAKFRKATVEAFPVLKPAWATNKVKDLAVFLHANMDREGRVYKQKSLTEVCRILHVSRDLAVRLYRVMEQAGVIVRSQAAPGKMAEVSVSTAVKGLIAEQYGFEVWPQAAIERPINRRSGKSALVRTSVPPRDTTQWSGQAVPPDGTDSLYQHPDASHQMYSETTSHQEKLTTFASEQAEGLKGRGGGQGGIELEPTSNLPPNISMPDDLKQLKKESCARVVYATNSKDRVRSATRKWGIGAPIFGLDDETAAWVDRASKLNGDAELKMMVGLNVDAVWEHVARSVSAHSPAEARKAGDYSEGALRTKASIMRLEGAIERGEVDRSRTSGMISSWAKTISVEAAKAELEIETNFDAILRRARTKETYGSKLTAQEIRVKHIHEKRMEAKRREDFLQREAERRAREAEEARNPKPAPSPPQKSEQELILEAKANGTYLTDERWAPHRAIDQAREAADQRRREKEAKEKAALDAESAEFFAKHGYRRAPQINDRR